MASIFISYSTANEEEARRLYTSLSNNGFEAWFAPVDIPTGGDFAEYIGKELRSAEAEEGLYEINREKMKSAKIFIVLLSKDSMASPWVNKEIAAAINARMNIKALKIDNTFMPEKIQWMLEDIQYENCPHLGREAINRLIEYLESLNIKKNIGTRRESNRKKYRPEDLGIKVIEQGDPYYLFGETLKATLSRQKFFISPPMESLSEEETEWVRSHISNGEALFDMTWDEVYKAIPIADLGKRIDLSRKKVLKQFLNRENGCYFNNKKYGVSDVRRFERMEDAGEQPRLTLVMYETDYYTHRVMKDVCKQLIAEGDPFLTAQLDYNDLRYSRIFFTSLGVNVLLSEDELRKDRKVLLTSRSTNAAETYSKHLFSLSAIEGVSLSDYDPFTRNVDLNAAVTRGLLEEIGVDESMIKTDKIHFYDLFVNCKNLEMGLTCSVELKRDLTIEEDVKAKRGKDEALEVADKMAVKVTDLRKFVTDNDGAFLPAAVFTACSLLEARGTQMFERFNKAVRNKEMFIQGKDGKDVCGDVIVDCNNYIAVIDGSTPKGTRLWDDQRGDVYIAHTLGKAIEKLDEGCTAQEALLYLNNEIKAVYKRNEVEFATLAAEERLQASIVIYSKKRHEIWSFGDCKISINGREYDRSKKLDKLMSDLRAYCIEAEMLKGKYSPDESQEDVGRKKILPFLKEQSLFANADCSFGYDVLDGGDINADKVNIYIVQTGDRVVLASDGYPKLFGSVKETEAYLKKALRADPQCIYELRGTKGLIPGNVSYDDRAYIGFSVE